MHEVITKSLSLWTSAILQQANGGVSKSGQSEAYGIEKLRELILELAVRGKLVQQDPSDEPARVLLARVASDRARMAREGRPRKELPLSDIDNSSVPFDLPAGWVWARICDVGHDWGQKIPEDGFTYIDVSAIDNYRGVISTPTVLSASDAPSRARKIVKRGTVIYSTVRPYLKNIAVVEEDYLPEPIASTAFALLHPYQEMPGRFFALYLRSPEFVRYVESVQTGIAYPAINDKQFYGALVPIPPLAEQHRIVARAYELMALCDNLEQLQTQSIEAHQCLVEALLRALTGAASHGELTEAWTRIANQFDTLITSEDSIDQLKRSILQLAVTGRLVPQDPNNEPASTLLERILEVRKRGIRHGKVKKATELPAIDVGEVPFCVPVGWTWARFEQLIDPESPLSYGVLVPGPDVDGGVPFVRIEDLDVKNPPERPAKSIAREIEGKYERTRLEGGEILMGVVGSIGKLGIAPKSWKGANIARAICRIKPTSAVSKQFVVRLLQSEFMQRGFVDDTRTLAQPTLNIGLIRAALVPLPPFAEQERIVAKVDELMALCDALRTRITDAQTIQIRLADATVEQAVA